MTAPRMRLPRLLPVTGFWALPLVAYQLLLQGRVVYLRLKNEKYMGKRLSSGSAIDNEHSNPDPLQLAIRSHSNFTENVPLAMVLAVIVELNGGNRKWLNYGMAALMFFRLMHVEFGMYGKDTMGPGRVIGHAGTQAWLVGMAAYGAYLVKGYWGC
ncbi:hypothetical protein MMC30_005814 [Trapelia coarctata]|nr:hypothetical protein [Trapelia coarctata]